MLLQVGTSDIVVPQSETALATIIGLANEFEWMYLMFEFF